METSKIEKTGILETLLGVAMDVLPILLALAIISWGGKAFAEGHGLFVQEGKDKFGDKNWVNAQVVITEQEAASSLAVGKILEDEGLITSRYAFFCKAKLMGVEDGLLPGAYHFSSDMTMEQMLAQMSAAADEAAAAEAGAPGAGAAQEDRDDSEKENRDVWGQ